MKKLVSDSRISISSPRVSSITAVPGSLEGDDVKTLPLQDHEDRKEFLDIAVEAAEDYHRSARPWRWNNQAGRRKPSNATSRRADGATPT